MEASHTLEADLAARASRLAGLPPLIITCAITGDHQKTGNPNLPVTIAEQAEAAAAAMAAGAAIIHVHGRDPLDPTKPARDANQYRAIASAIRARAPEAIVDFTQSVASLDANSGLAGTVHRYASVAMHAGPDVMSLNPGPMTFRGASGNRSSAIVTTFDDTARIAEELRMRGIKPQVFLYHPGHLDLLHHLIELDLLARPIWVQLVFGQQSGISATPESVLYMVGNLPRDVLFQLCAVNSASIEVALLAVLLGGHVRTGMEDALFYRAGELVIGNDQLVSRVVRIATEVGRRVATPAEARAMLGIQTTTD